MPEPMKYCAFLSYNRADVAVAKWLLRGLETYRVPKNLVGTAGKYGTITRRLGKVFRDRDELAAADDLGAVVREGLADSAALIVLCSPDAARSRWVNAEIEAYREVGSAQRIYAYVIGGDPGVLEGPQCPFPPALISRDAAGNVREPMAADARSDGDGRDRAFIKLVAGLLGVSFDELARRESQRRLRRITAIAAASLAGMLVTTVLATAAYLARNDAARRQTQAEDILGFMLGDLRGKLTKVGRLDIMRAVDDKATVYFATLDARDISDRSLESQARLLTGIGQERTEEGDQNAALSAFREAYARSSALYRRKPGDGQRLFDLAQAEYWIGWVEFKQARYEDADAWLRRYRDSALELAAKDRGNFAWQKEVAYGEQNLAIVDEARGRYAEAEQATLAQIALYRQWLAARPADLPLREEEANALSWLSTLSLRQGKLRAAQEYAATVIEAIDRNIAAEPANMEWASDVVDADMVLADAQAQQGEFAAARAVIDRANSAALGLTERDPANNDWRVSLGNSYWRQALLPHSVAEAAERAGAAVRVLETASQHEPDSEVTSRFLARARVTAARVAEVGGQLAAARDQVTLSFAALNPLWARAHSEELRVLLSEGWLVSGDVAFRSGDEDSARVDWQRARALLEEKPTNGMELPFTRLWCLAAAMDRLSDSAASEPLSRRLGAAKYYAPEPCTNDAAHIRIIDATSIARK